MEKTPMLVISTMLTFSILGCRLGEARGLMIPITKVKAVEIAKSQAVQDGVSAKDLESMRVSVKYVDDRYRIEWTPKDAYRGGFEYFVFVDSRSGKVLSSVANPLDPVPLKIKEK